MSKPGIGIRRLNRPNGRPRLSDQELLERERKRNANPIRRITPDQRVALEAIATGHSLEEAAERSGIPADDLAARIYRPEMIRAIEAVRFILHARIRDAALYELACIGGAIKGGRTPASDDEKVRAAALKTVVGSCRPGSFSPDTLRPYGDDPCADDGSDGNDEQPPSLPVPQLVLLNGEEGSQ